MSSAVAAMFGSINGRVFAKFLPHRWTVVVVVGNPTQWWAEFHPDGAW